MKSRIQLIRAGGEECRRLPADLAAVVEIAAAVVAPEDLPPVTTMYKRLGFGQARSPTALLTRLQV